MMNHYSQKKGGVELSQNSITKRRTTIKKPGYILKNKKKRESIKGDVKPEASDMMKDVRLVLS
jgi:hypothetical protein